MKRYVVLALFLLSTLSIAQPSLLSRKDLKGLKQVGVLIEDLDRDAMAEGLSVEQLKTDVELRLRRSSIKVPDDPATGDAYLYVWVSTLKIKDEPNWVYSIDVTLEQDARLVRTDAYRSATTWRAGTIGVVGSHQLVAAIRESVGNYVDRFTNDYLAANQ